MTCLLLIALKLRDINCSTVWTRRYVRRRFPEIGPAKSPTYVPVEIPYDEILISLPYVPRRPISFYRFVRDVYVFTLRFDEVVCLAL